LNEGKWKKGKVEKERIRNMKTKVSFMLVENKIKKYGKKFLFLSKFLDKTV
tara:strand:+ start:440 stop:592 length:153 start_codon:yes stop_codon:yes gene_type:complete